jgi:hypothetical protein
VIRVESEPDVGTDFRIYLPVAIGPGDELTARPGEPVQCGTETLLVVEDDGKLRATVCRILPRADIGSSRLRMRRERSRSRMLRDPYRTWC